MVENVTSKIRQLPAWVSDGIIALGLMVLGIVGMMARPFEPHGPRPPREFPDQVGSATNPFGRFHNPTPMAYVLTVIGFLPLAWRQQFPLAVLAVTSVTAATYDLFHFPPNLLFLAPLIALYTVASTHSRKTALAAGVASAAIQLAGAAAGSGSAQVWTESIRVVALLGVAGALGDAQRSRRAYVAEVEQRAIEAERTREEEARRRVDEERLRIARELHDITAHSLSIIAVQSGAAAHVLDSNPAEARRSLEAIRRTSKEALDELRSMLGVLRGAGESDAPLAPAPGLIRLTELVAPLTEAGFEVTVDIGSDLGEIPAMVESSAYRIVQESLTNIVRHAGKCRVWLTVARTDSTLDVLVENDGETPRSPLPAGGHGVAGMRERVTALGGTFEAEPREGGGFRVCARLPIARSN